MASRHERTQDISRVDAAELLNELAEVLAKVRDNPTPDGVARLVAVFTRYGISLPRECPGDAHSNPYIDNCGICIPHWGVIQTPIKVK